MGLFFNFRRTRRQLTAKDETFKAQLGDEQGVVNVPGRNGYVWVQRIGAAQDDDNSNLQPAIQVRTGRGAYIKKPKTRVNVGYDEDGELAILSQDHSYAVSVNYDLDALNPGAPRNRWLRISQFVNALVRAVATATTSSTSVSAEKLAYFDDYYDFQLFDGTPNTGDQYDLASLIPAAGKYVIALVYLDTFTNTLGAVATDAQDITASIIQGRVPDADYQGLDDKLPAEALPLQAFILKDNQSSVTNQDLAKDWRQFINVPNRRSTFPNPVTKNTRIRDGHSLITRGTVTVAGSAYLNVYGTWWT